MQFKTDFWIRKGKKSVINLGGYCTWSYDEVYMTPRIAEAPINPDKINYRVKFQTGFLPNSKSKSPSYIQLIGTKGRTMFYLLATSFKANAIYTRNLAVLEHNNIGNLKAIQLVSAGTDSVTFVNFFNIFTPMGESIQFKADFALDASPHNKNDLANKLYRFYKKKTIRAIHSEQSTGRLVKKYYQVGYTTGKSTWAASKSPMYIKFNGNRGSSNFQLLGSKFVKGRTVFKNYLIRRNLGLLQSITIMAGGRDSWLTAGAIKVRTANGEPMAFKTNFFLDEQPNKVGIYGKYKAYDTRTLKAVKGAEPPLMCRKIGDLNCCGNGVCDADEQRSNCARDCNQRKKSWGKAKWAQKTTAPKKANKAKWLVNKATGITNAPTPYNRMGHITKAPTPARKVYRLKSCRLGGMWIKSGWKSKGHGNNYCNLCSCVNGILSCTKRLCGLPWYGRTPKHANLCKHVQCFGKAYKSARGLHHKVVVKHVGKERTTHHRCAFNTFGKKCTCMCYGTKAPVYIREKTTAWANVQSGCRFIKFAGNGFNPRSGYVKVLATLNKATDGFVDVTNAKGFTYCTKSKGARLSYYAYQRFPYSGAKTGMSHVGIKANVNIKGPTCKVIKFNGNKFREIPVVIGTLDHKNGNGKATDSIVSWVENVNKNQFRFCVRESIDSQSKAHHASAHRSIHFNWVAFSHKNPSLWYKANHLPYLQAGNVAVKGCKWVKFGRTYRSVPKVLTTANHQSHKNLDWSAAPHDGVFTYVPTTSRTGFKVCAKEMAMYRKGNEDGTLKVSYAVMA